MTRVKNFLPYARQSVDALDVRAVSRVLFSEKLTTGPEVAAFERELARACSARFAVVCSSGTAALHLSAVAFGLQKGDQVLTTPNTFLATANAARFAGADVVFSDIDPATGNLSLTSLEKNLKANPRIKAVFAVDFAGQPAEMDKIRALSRRYGCKVLEDAAHSLGASYLSAGRRVQVGSCRDADATVFSFHPIKAITTGEGGAVTTNDPVLAKKLLRARNHGMERRDAWHYEMSDIGFNYRLTDIQCALGRSQLKKLSRFIRARRAAARWYQEELRAAFPDGVRPLTVRKGVGHAYHLFALRVDFGKFGVTRQEVIRRLEKKGIGTQIHYIPVHRQPYYRALSKKRLFLPGMEQHYRETLSLPMYASLSRADVRRVVRGLKEALGR